MCIYFKRPSSWNHRTSFFLQAWFPVRLTSKIASVFKWWFSPERFLLSLCSSPWATQIPQPSCRFQSVQLENIVVGRRGEVKLSTVGAVVAGAAESESSLKVEQLPHEVEVGRDVGLFALDKVIGIVERQAKVLHQVGHRHRHRPANASQAVHQHPTPLRAGFICGPTSSSSSSTSSPLIIANIKPPSILCLPFITIQTKYYYPVFPPNHQAESQYQHPHKKQQHQSLVFFSRLILIIINIILMLNITTSKTITIAFATFIYSLIVDI